jgi:hypothetical protein
MAISNQPDNLNLLQAVSFETNFVRIPHCNYFCQKVSIPSMVIGSAVQPTMFSDIPLEGEKLTFDPLNISFLVDEDLQNYQEIYTWLVSMGFPDNFSQFTSLKKPPVNSSTDGIYSDINVIINTNKANPSYNITFRDAFPITLGSIDFDAAADGLDPIIVDASFMFTSVFTIEKIS